MKIVSNASTIIPWLLSIATIGAGIWQYADKQAQANREPFLRKQLDYMFQASEAVSILSTTTDTATWTLKRDEFWKLYWGPLAIVEDPDVEYAMVRAGRLIPAPGSPPPANLPQKELQVPSLDLSHEIRDLILESWGVDLAPLAQSKQEQ